MPNLCLTIFRNNVRVETLGMIQIHSETPEEIYNSILNLAENYRRDHRLDKECNKITVKDRSTSDMGQWYIILNNNKYPTKEDKITAFREWLNKRCVYADCKYKRKLLNNIDQMFGENKPIEIHIDNDADDCFIIFL